MEEICLVINEIPAILWGAPSEKVYLFIHGKNGNKEAARDFAIIAASKGYQVISIDLPEHGERKQGRQSFTPWCVVPELRAVMTWAKQCWSTICLRADSIGAWFSMLSFAEDNIEKCLFVSPVLDMEKLICTMMKWASVSEEKLRQEQEIQTNFGEKLSWEYLSYVREHLITEWNIPTAILYPENDNLTERNTVDRFVAEFKCELKVSPNGEHWFHTSEQLDILEQWTKTVI